MDYRSGAEADFLNVETFVWQAIFPAFNHPDLSEQQRAENDAIVEEAEGACLSAVALPEREVIVAYDKRQRRLAGFIILDKSPVDYPEISWIIVSRKYWGSGVADGLIRRGIEWLGTNRSIKTSLHYYLERARAFFERYDFRDTGETAGDHLIPRLLLLREAGPLPADEVADPEQMSIAVNPPEAEVHNPLEPEEGDQPFPEPQSTAPDLFSGSMPTDEPDAEAEEGLSEKEATEGTPASKYRDIEFEVDYGDTAQADDQPSLTLSSGLDFEFAFDSAAEQESPEPEETDLERALDLEDFKVAGETKEAVKPSVTDPEPELEMPELDVEPEKITPAEKTPKLNTGDKLNKLRLAFQDYFMEMVTDLFGNHAAVDYWKMLQSSDFRELVDNSLRQYQPGGSTSFNQLAGDLIEYFVVETAADLHDHAFPQRALRHQTKSLEQTDLFTLISDYLDLANEHERVDSDFITIAPKRLRNATKNFLLASSGERIFFLVDQSMLGNLKQGFAFTDRGFYWKAVLQPNHVVYFAESPKVKMEKGAVVANEHFFDTGKKSFNLKIVLLLKKLSRLFDGQQ